jgi:ComF family protein
MRALSSAANALVATLLAPACAACGRPLAQPLQSPVCEDCWRAVPALTPPWCARCGDAVASWREASLLCARCRRAPPRFAVARSAGRYDGSLRQIVHAFKYRRRRLLAGPLAGLMRHAAADLLVGADAVVPVPLSARRALQRGFNQADDLACHLGLPVWRALRRVRHGPPQAALPAARRHGNVRRAFSIRARPALLLLGASWASRLRDATIVLVDDVMTTGATLDACGQALLEAGALSVRAMTVARAVAAPRGRSQPPPRPGPAPRR